AVASAKAALEALAAQEYDCMIVDLGLPDVSGEELIETVRREERFAQLPAIVYTARTLTRDEETRLRELSSTVIVKDGRAPERLLDELRFFLNRVESELPAYKRSRPADTATQTLAGCKALIVDDDSRNIAALQVTLEGHGVIVRTAESGLRAIELLQREPEMDIILMDIMMPEMDGYETIRRIRADDAVKHIPIVALTAKAMKGDRDACIAAGASEYVSKPVDVDQLISLLRIWLAR
ncbi:MAG TPA: response regulator, partial [Candidatus Tumulicola sp.]|nr:response regulator [Candidatus Tumulicola sp.]